MHLLSRRGLLALFGAAAAGAAQSVRSPDNPKSDNQKSPGSFLSFGSQESLTGGAYYPTTVGLSTLRGCTENLL